VLPTLIANTFFLPRHLLPHKAANDDVERAIPAQAPASEQA